MWGSFFGFPAGRVPLIVELKIEWTDLALCPVVQDMLAGYQGVYCIESFNPLAVVHK